MFAKQQLERNGLNSPTSCASAAMPLNNSAASSMIKIRAFMNASNAELSE
jgi:hypothetical protein